MKKAFLSIMVLFLFGINLSAQQGGYALQFDGTNDYVDVTTTNLPSSGNITLEVWINVKNFDTDFWEGVIIERKGSSSHGYMLRTGGSGIIEFYIGSSYATGNSVISSTGTITLNTWYHVAGTYDGTNLKLYVDGKLIGTTAYSGGQTGNSTCNLGRSPAYTNRLYEGKIDEVRIWNIARTEAEIKANMYKEIGIHTNLKAYYKMTDGTGTSLTDNSGNSNTGTLTSGPVWKSSGCFAGSRQTLDFDGSNDYVNIPANIAYNTNTFTVEFWVKANSSQAGNFRGIVDKGRYTGSGLDWYFLTYAGNGVIILGLPGVGEVWFGTDGNWHHIAGTYDGTTLRGYLDGVLDNDLPTGTRSSPSANGITVGRTQSNDYYFNGQIDELKLWNTARTATEIREGMFRTISGNETNLVGYYRFDHKDGTTLFDFASTANNGTLTNMDGATDWVSSTAFNTWIGGESSSWSTAANWSNGVPASAQSAGIYNWSSALPNVTTYLTVLPTTVSVNNLLVPSGVTTAGNVNLTATGSVFLGSNLTLSSSALNTAKDLVVESGKTLTLPATSQLTIARQLDNQGSFTMQSGSSLITNGTITNSGTMQISRTMSESVWHMISIPVSGITANAFLGDYLQSWDETNGVWVNISNPLTALNTKQGYSLWATPAKSDATYSFTGTLLTGDQSTPITYHAVSGKEFDGANLLGNPYPSSIDWDQLQATYGSNYIWDGTAYKAYSSQSGYELGYRYIPPMQGFFILTTNPTGNFNLTNTARTHTGAANFYKSTNNKSFSNGIVLEAGNGSYSDQWCLVFNPEASEGFELPRDARKLLSGTTGISQLWSVSPDGKLAIDIRPETETIQLGFANDQAGIYTIAIREMADIQGAALEDTKTGIFHNLQTGSYEFTWNPETDPETRFKLHLNSVGIEESPIGESNILIYAANGQIFVKGATNGEMTISDVTGRVVLQQEIRGKETLSIQAILQTGVYLVTVQNGKEVKTEKVFVK